MVRRLWTKECRSAPAKQALTMAQHLCLLMMMVRCRGLIAVRGCHGEDTDFNPLKKCMVKSCTMVSVDEIVLLYASKSVTNLGVTVEV